MSSEVKPDLNHFLSGHLVVNKDRKIIFCNDYIHELINQSDNKVIDTPISKYITKASNIFLDSYIYPLLLTDSTAQEIQITWLNSNGEKIPVIVNIKLDKDGLSYWSVYICINRDKLQNEWLSANKKLEKQSQELFNLATTDPLTGLLNRREFQEQTKKLISQTDRSASTFALLSIDVDFFKHVNDTHGHQVGDKVLIHLAKLFNKNRRANDLVSRFGGEEFILVLPDITNEDAYQLAEKLRLNVERNPIDNIQITLSIGLVVTKKAKKVNLEQLLKTSDKALYMSKATGRNKTSVAELE